MVKNSADSVNDTEIGWKAVRGNGRVVELQGTNTDRKGVDVSSLG
jgi:hypothetical protein